VTAYFPARTLLLAASELVMMFTALVTATYVRFRADGTIMLFYENGGERVAIVCLVCLLCIYYYDLYDSTVLASAREVFLWLVQVVGTSCIILAVLLFSLSLHSDTYEPICSCSSLHGRLSGQLAKSFFHRQLFPGACGESRFVRRRTVSRIRGHGN